MATNNVTNQKSKKPSKMAVLYSKLDVAKDERLTRTPIDTGRVSHFFRTVKNNYSGMMIANLVFLLFALPAILIIFWYAPTMRANLNALLDFNGSMGIGFGGHNDIQEGMLNIYHVYENMFLFLIPCFTVMGLGMAGLFYCARNYLWGAPVKIRTHFFRGIKKAWLPFLFAFTYLGGVVCMMGCSILEYMKADLLGKVNGGHWVFMIASALLLLLSAMYFAIELPMQVSFRIKYKSIIKNSILLTVSIFPIILIVLIFMALPMLCMLNSFMSMLLYVTLAMIGVMFYVTGVTALAHNTFDSTIIPLYEHELRKKEILEKKEKEKVNRQKNRSKKRR